MMMRTEDEINGDVGRSQSIQLMNSFISHLDGGEEPGRPGAHHHRRCICIIHVLRWCVLGLGLGIPRSTCSLGGGSCVSGSWC
jgi:hypothetical protein